MVKKTVMGGAGAALTGGNFWQGAVTGLIVSGLNHALHDGDGGGDPPKRDFKTWFKNKLKEMDRIVSSSPRNALRFYFNTVENVGTTLEVFGLVAAPFSKGASLSLLHSFSN